MPCVQCKVPEDRVSTSCVPPGNNRLCDMQNGRRVWSSSQLQVLCDAECWQVDAQSHIESMDELLPTHARWVMLLDRMNCEIALVVAKFSSQLLGERA